MQHTNARGTWAKFKRNKFALTGFFFIIITAFSGLLGYLIMPDSTPMANNMALQLSIKKPGSQYLFLNFNKTEPVEKAGLLGRMLFGQPELYHQIPINAYHFKNDSIVVSEYIGDEESGENTSYPITEVIGKRNMQQLKTSSTAQINQYVAKNNIIHKTFWLGTDLYGRDMLSRLILGIRVSLSVGILAVLISLTIGVSLGAIAGYYGGRVDAAISWVMNVIWSLPALLLVIAISFALGKGFWQIFIAVGLSMWVDVARLVRGQVMALKNMEFIEAARAMGFKDMRIISKHILPNISGPILVAASSNFASAILLEAGLSFLGFGAQPPIPTWGGMIKEHYGYIIMDAAYLAILPGLAIMLLVYAFNLVAVGLRDAFDVKSQTTNV